MFFLLSNGLPKRFTVNLIPITSIRIDGGTQSRAALSNEVIDHYKDLIEDGKQMPPIQAMFDGADYWLVDGFHRWHASRKAGHTEIEVDVTNGTKREAILASLSANKDHGLQRTKEDRRKAVLIMLQDDEWSKWSIRKIASICDVHPRDVTRIVNERQIERPAVVLSERGGKVMQQKVREKPVKPSEPVVTDTSVPVVTDEAEQESARMLVELSEENEIMRQKLAVVTGESEAQSTLAELQQEIKTIRAELNATRNSRDDLARENAELKKQITYWKKRHDDAVKAVPA